MKDKVIFVQSMNIDCALSGTRESPVDDKGYFLFDFSNKVPFPLV